LAYALLYDTDMKLDIIQDDTDCVDYLAEVADFIRRQLGGRPTAEQLESRFDALLTAYALDRAAQGYTANYDAATKTLRIFS
jgi:hypothetical protein